jgi:hypothetical protein
MLELMEFWGVGIDREFWGVGIDREFWDVGIDGVLGCWN